ncbi:hypothetical protein TWF718_009727 [Orbilia javanica]|uniref:Uncharacterized protein n=1 Tax=Orbilia javanica TaxID=47235 RepID=A0AAN8MU59_9PEZI
MEWATTQTIHGVGHLDPFQFDVTVFDRKVVHNGWNKIYEPTGCGTTIQSHIHWVQKYNEADWLRVAREGKGWYWLEHDTPPGGRINVTAQIHKMAQNEKSKTQRKDSASGQFLNTGIPKVVPGGTLSATIWQVNQDGGGPFKCMIDYNGTGDSWKVINDGPHNPSSNCGGDSYSIRGWGGASACTMTYQLPADLDCKGNYGPDAQNICIVRCENYAVNGPFGGCMAVQQLRPIPIVQVEEKPVEVAIIEPAKDVVLSDTIVTVTKNNFITIVEGRRTRVSSVAKDRVVTVTQVLKQKAKTRIETRFQKVTVKHKALPTKKGPKIPSAKPTPRPPATEKLTEDELEAGLGGEEYDEETLEKIKNTPITSEEKEKLENQVEELGDQYFKRKLRFHRD